MKSLRTRKSPWTLDEKLMVFGPTLFILGLGAFSWREGRSRMISVYAVNHAKRDDGAYDINEIEFSPDSQRLVAVYQGPNGGMATVYNASTQERLVDLAIPAVPPGSPAIGAVIQHASWTLNGNYLAGIVDDGSVGATKIKTTYKPYFRFNIQHKIATWGAASGNLIWAKPYARTSADSNTDLQVSRDGKTLIGQGAPAVLFDAATGAPRTPADNSAPVGQFNCDGSLLAVTRPSDKMLEVRDAKTERVLWQPKIKRPVALWSANNVLGVFEYRTKNEQHLQLWDGGARRALGAPLGHHVADFDLNSKRPQVAFAEVKMRVAPSRVASSREVESAVLRVWDYGLNKELWHRALNGETKPIWSPDGRWLCAVERAGAFPGANVWIFDANGEVHSRFGRSAVGVVAWAPDSKTLAIAELNQIELKTVG